MIVLKCVQWRQSFVYDSFLVTIFATVVEATSSAPCRLGKLALGGVVLHHRINGVLFGDAVSDALQDNLDPAVQSC